MSRFTDNVAKDGFAITPSGTPFTIRAQAIYIGVAGNVTLTTVGGTSLEFIGLQAGQILPVSALAVTTATATGLIGLLAT